MCVIKNSLIILALSLIGCASTSAPSGWLPSPANSASDVYGGWATVEIDSADKRQDIQGELIAVEFDTMYVLSRRGLHAVPKKYILNAKVAYFEGDYSGISAWTLLGTISTISHGFYLLITAPLWIVTGSLTAASVSHNQVVEYPDHSWDELKMYSRFPQGLPASLDRQSLKLKK